MLIITTEIYGCVREMILPSVHRYMLNVPKNEDWRYASKITVFRKRGSVTTITFALDNYFSSLNYLLNRIPSRLPIYYQPAEK